MRQLYRMFKHVNFFFYFTHLAEQPIKDAVITVPAFFNQAERRAVLQAAQMAGLKVLQLINDNTAVALNYGVFRRKDIDSTAKVHVLNSHEIKILCLQERLILLNIICGLIPPV